MSQCRLQSGGNKILILILCVFFLTGRRQNDIRCRAGPIYNYKTSTCARKPENCAPRAYDVIFFRRRLGA